MEGIENEYSMVWHRFKRTIPLKQFSVPKSMWHMIDYKREYKDLNLETHQSEETIYVTIVQQWDNVTRGILWPKLRTAIKKKTTVSETRQNVKLLTFLNMMRSWFVL